MNAMKKIYLIRHGQIKGYEKIPVYGHTDVELTEIGILQMKQVAERLRLTELDAIYSSDLKRSATGARLIARHHDVPVSHLPELREMFFGDWEGMQLAEIRKRFPDELEKRKTNLIHYQIPGDGETIAQLASRISRCITGLLEKKDHKRIAIVAHGAVNRVILCDALAMDLSSFFKIHQDYGCLNIIDYLEDTTLVRMMNG